MTDKLQKKMEQVRALLAKAESTTFPEEADAFRAKADQLMTAYSIEGWMVEQLEAGRDVRQMPERRDFDRAWRNSRFRQELLEMFADLAQHCRCVVGYRGADYKLQIMPVYGLPADLDYLDVLFTSLMVEVAKNLQPPVDPNGDLGEEVYKQRQAGIAWPDITRKVFQAGLVTLTTGEFTKLKRATGDALEGMDAEDVGWEELNHYYAETVRDSIKNRLANANRRYVKEMNLQGERNYVKPEVYQRSFMWGFSEEIRRRLRSMRMASETKFDTDHKPGSMALAVRDIYAQAMTLYDNEFPPPPPAPPAPPGKRSKAPAVRYVTIDEGARHAGAVKAREANLSNQPSRRVGGNKKQLDG